MSDVTRWWEDALCAQLYPEGVFFQDGGGSQNAARRVCNACPVQPMCLESALAEEGRLGWYYAFGFRGGKTASERVALMRDLGVPEDTEDTAEEAA